MKGLKLTLHRIRGGAPIDLALVMEPGLTVGALAGALATRDPEYGSGTPESLTVALHGPDGVRALPEADLVETSGLMSGTTVSLLQATASYPQDQPARQAGTLQVIAGPDAPRTLALYHGINTIGRDPECTVVLSDPLLSKNHARIIIDSYVEIMDNNSTNGVVIGGGPVTRKVLTASDRVTLGDTVIEVQAYPSIMTAGTQGRQNGAARRSVVPFNRSPRLDPPYEGETLEAPAPPQRRQGRRLPIVPMLVPILMGAMLFTLTRSPLSLIFVALSPMMLLGSYFEEKSAQRTSFRQATTDFKSALADLSAQLLAAAEAEKAARITAHPATAAIVREAMSYGHLLWTRRPEHQSFLDLRLGLGTQPSRTTVRMPSGPDRSSPLLGELTALVEPFSTLDNVPVVARLTECGALGIAGHDERAREVAWSIIAQLVTLHSPAEVVVTAVMSSASARDWDWLKWLPHTSPHPLSPHTPLRSPHLTTGGDGATRLIAEVDDLIAQRATARSSAPTPLPVVIVLVTDDTDVDRARLVEVAERGPAAGVHVIWCAPNVQRLPAACRSYLVVDPNAGVGNAGFVRSGESVEPVSVEPLAESEVQALARRLSPVIDSGARVDDESGLPGSVSLVDIARKPIDRSAQAVIDRWSESRSISTGPYAVTPDRRHEPHLRALVGAVGVDEPFHLDLRTQGPHALVGGITGAGKSELLQSWLLGLATAHSPQRVTFLLVDYKGGSAFGACSQLPHSIGLVTDLNPHLVQRALTSLRAELKHREELVNEHQVKDLVDLEKEKPSLALPRLVIVVDEFAALKKEIPDFVDGVVDIAQRGRSLGLHLILATQRPTGVITDNLRANMNLRVALRMADDTDSSDVLGSALAAAFDPDIPGRAAARTGPGRLVTFQAAYAGGWTTGAPPAPRLVVSTLPFGLATAWEQPPATALSAPRDPGPNDVSRIVTTVQRAFELVQVDLPRKPWLPELPPVLDLTTLLEGSAREFKELAELGETVPSRPLIFGRRDLPGKQTQPPAYFEPDRRGNLVVYGTGGTGKSTLLRTLAVAAASGQAGPTHIYGIDSGGRGLDMLEALPQAAPIVRGEDSERVVRLLDRLRATIAKREEVFSHTNASSIDAHWQRTGVDGLAEQWEHPRILLLLDGVADFIQRYQPGGMTGVFERLLVIATAGRRFGIHLVLSADRPGAIPGSLAAAVQTRVVLRQAGDNDYAALGLRRDVIDPTSPPGRGLLDQEEIQVAVPGSDDLSVQQARVEAIAAASGHVVPVQEVRVLGTEVRLSDLPRQGLADEPVIAVDRDTLEPVTFKPQGLFAISGPAGSGRTTALRTLATSLRAWRPTARIVLLAKSTPALSEAPLWTHQLSDVKSAAQIVSKELADRADDPVVLVVENFPDFVTDTDLPGLIKACQDAKQLVVAEGELGAMAGLPATNEAVRMFRSRRTGLALHPNMQHTTVFGVDMSKLPRPPDPPPGRALLLDLGMPRLVQVALPE